MHTQRNRIFFFGSTVLTGLASLGLHRYMMENCFDHKGLLIAGNLPGTLLWVLGIGYVAALSAMLTTLGGEGGYEDNFPKCRTSGTLLLIAGVLLLLTRPRFAGVGEAVLPGGGLAVRITDAAMVGMPWAAGAAMLVLGVYRMQGRKPHPVFSGLVCLYDMLMLVTSYRLWSADPKLHEYAYQLLALVLLMIAAFHRTGCDAGIIQRRKLLFTGLTAAVCCTAALSMELMAGFYLASGLWAVGCMCDPSVLPPDPEEEQTENEENEEDEDVSGE